MSTEILTASVSRIFCSSHHVSYMFLWMLFVYAKPWLNNARRSTHTLQQVNKWMVLMFYMFLWRIRTHISDKAPVLRRIVSSLSLSLYVFGFYIVGVTNLCDVLQWWFSLRQRLPTMTIKWVRHSNFIFNINSFVPVCVCAVHILFVTFILLLKCYICEAFVLLLIYI